jgi:predicted N-acyltransferase
MSDTPRTDALREQYAHHLPNWLATDVFCPLAGCLERELAEARGQRDALVDALRKAVAWGDVASMHILYRENINWELIDEARATLNANLTKP